MMTVVLLKPFQLNWFLIFGINGKIIICQQECMEPQNAGGNFLIPKIKSDNWWRFTNSMQPLHFGKTLEMMKNSNQGKASSTVWGTHPVPRRYLTWLLVILTFLVLVSNVWLQQSNFKTIQYIRNHE